MKYPSQKKSNKNSSKVKSSKIQTFSNKRISFYFDVSVDFGAGRSDTWNLVCRSASVTVGRQTEFGLTVGFGDGRSEN